jgi:hypothetical protein
MYLVIRLPNLRKTRKFVNIAAVPTEWIVAMHEDLFDAEMDAAVRSDQDESHYVVIATPEAERFEAGQITAVARQGRLTLKKA